MTGSQGVSGRPLVAVLVAVALIVTGCQPSLSRGDGGQTPDAAALSWSGSPEDAPDTWAQGVDPDSEFGLHERAGLEPVLRPETRVLTAQETAALTAVEITNRDACLTDAPDHPMCRFLLTFSAVPDDVTVGSVLNAGITSSTPDGLLVKVVEVDGTKVRAVQATLQDALVQGEFWVERAFEPSELRGDPVLAPGVTMVTRPSGGRGSTAGVPTFDGLSLPGALSLDVEPVDGVKVTGTLDFGAGCGLAGGVGGSSIAWMEIACTAWEKASLDVTATKDGPADAERYTVALIPLAGFPIPIGPVVVVVIVDILVTVDLSGNVHVGLSYGGGQRTEVSGGLRYSIRHGLDHTGAVSSHAWTGRNELAKAVSAGATGRAELRLSAYGVLGVGVGADMTVLFSGDPTTNTRWRVSGDAGVFIRMFLGLLGFELTAQLRYSFKEPVEIGTWQNSGPTIEIVWPKDGEVITLGGLARSVEASATDPEDGPLPVTWKNLTTGATASGTGPLDLGFQEGTNTLEVRAVDSYGQAEWTTLTVTVRPPELAVDLGLLRADGTALPLPPSGRSGSTIIVEAAISSGAILSDVGCADLTWSAVNAAVSPGGGCRRSVRLGEPGTATISASLTDSHGTQARDSVAVNVTAAGSTVTPEFRGIDVTMVNGSVGPGVVLPGGVSIEVSVEYLNSDQAKVTPTYTWTVAVDGGQPVALTGGDGGGIRSTRDYTPSSAAAHTAEFAVVVTDSVSGAELTRRTRTVVWQSAPK